MEVLLVRHGESADNAQRRIQGWSGSGLTDRGRAEAIGAAEYIATLGISHLWSSDLRRAAETAAIIGERVGVEARHDEAFREMTLGPWEGRVMADVEADDGLALWTWRYDGRTPVREGIEPVAGVLGRMLRGIERIRATEASAGDGRSSRAVVVTHGGAISITLTHLVGLDCVRIWQMPTANGSISRLRWQNGAWRVVSWNETGHLPPRPEGMNMI